jgi:hypothetical protein
VATATTRPIVAAGSLPPGEFIARTVLGGSAKPTEGGVIWRYEGNTVSDNPGQGGGSEYEERAKTPSIGDLCHHKARRVNGPVLSFTLILQATVGACLSILNIPRNE